jgi:hypothetical protein
MKLIPQKNNSSCWYASAQMLIEWKCSTSFETSARHPNPSQVKEIVMWEIAGNGLVNPRVLQMAKLLGLKAIPAICVTLAMLESHVRHYGPLWTNGKEHIVVIGGVDQSAGTVLVYDPWPVNVGKIEWRPFAGWYLGATPPAATDPDSSRDTDAGVRATFLYVP